MAYNRKTFHCCSNCFRLQLIMSMYFDIIVSMLETINNMPIYGLIFNIMDYSLMLVKVV
jgi:hypothetical protein